MTQFHHPSGPLVTRGQAAGPAGLEAGIAAYRAGRLDEAEACYRQVLRATPRHPVALHLLGVVVLQRGEPEAALAWLRKALAARPEYPEALNTLGIAFVRLGQFDQALVAFERACRQQAGFADAHSNRGNALKALGRADQALEAYDQALRLNPGLADAWFNRGLLLAGAGRLAEAVSAYQTVQRLIADGSATRAVDAGVVALRLGEALLVLGQAAEAEAALNRSLGLDPGSAEALVNLGLLLEKRGASETALMIFRQVCRSHPGLPEAHNNLGNLLRSLGRFKQALAVYQRGLDGAPGGPGGEPEMIFNRGLARLAVGECGAGWADYEERWHSRQLAGGRRATGGLDWSGRRLVHRSLVIWREQGVGDEIMFSTLYADAVAAAGGPVTIEADARLVPLLARAVPGTQVVPAGRPADAPALPAATVACAAGSLAGHLRPRLDAWPVRPAPWLAPRPELAALWRQRLAALGPGLKVGLCWRSSRLTGRRSRDYAPLEAFVPVLRLPGLCPVSLQWDGAADLARFEAGGSPLRLARWDDLDLRDDFEAVAALIAGLDLVISAPTAVGELAGALGVPVWRTDRLGSWTLLGTGCRPWFPAMRPWIAAPGAPLAGVLAGLARHLGGLCPPPSAGAL